MALKQVREGKSSGFRKATEIAIGETVTGYLVGLPANRFNEGEKDVVLRNKETGEETRIATAGQLKRDVNDGYLKVGQLTSITRKADRAEKSKAGKAYTLTDFETLQDSDDTTADLSFINPTSDSGPVAPKFDIAQVKAQAAAIKEQSKSAKS